MSFDPAAILSVLVRHGVDFIVVGGVAANLHGFPDVTVDLDVVPEERTDNLQRLSEALTELHARVRAAGVPGGLPFQHDGRSLARSQIWNLTTDHGDLDIIFQPGGIAGFDALIGTAIRSEIRGDVVLVAALDDVIRSKENAGRPKDLAKLPALRVLRDEVRRRSTPP